MSSEAATPDPTPVAVASRSFSRYPWLREKLLARYPNVRFNLDDRALAGRELIDFLRGCPLAIVGLEPIDETVLAALPDLRVIAKYGVGLDGLDLAALERRRIRLGWQGGVNRLCVAELTLAFMIALLHRFPESYRSAREGGWKAFPGHNLTDRTIGIIGCGHVGKEVVRLLSPFRCRILVNDLRDYADFYAGNGVTPVSLETLLLQSDVVTLHVPFDASTENLLSRERLALMPPGAVLVNAARGGLVDEAAVLERLDAGLLAGAAFDVFADEPPRDNPLIKHPRVICTTHIGGGTREAIEAMGNAAIENLERADLPSRLLPELRL